MSKLILVDNYTPKSTDKVFLDTNIWLHLFTPALGKTRSKTEKTGKLYKELLNTKAQLYTSSIVISEFLNAYSRIVFNYHKDLCPTKFKDYKRDFRTSDEYKDLIIELDEIVNIQILGDCEKLDDKFTQLDPILISENFDVNDLIIMNICTQNQLKLITADNDFWRIPTKKSDIIII